jgi:hypothetical protein
MEGTACWRKLELEDHGDEECEPSSNWYVPYLHFSMFPFVRLPCRSSQSLIFGFNPAENWRMVVTTRQMGGTGDSRERG